MSLSPKQIKHFICIVVFLIAGMMSFISCKPQCLSVPYSGKFSTGTAYLATTVHFHHQLLDVCMGPEARDQTITLHSKLKGKDRR